MEALSTTASPKSSKTTNPRRKNWCSSRTHGAPKPWPAYSPTYNNAPSKAYSATSSIGPTWLDRSRSSSETPSVSGSILPSDPSNRSSRGSGIRSTATIITSAGNAQTIAAPRAMTVDSTASNWMDFATWHAGFRAGSRTLVGIRFAMLAIIAPCRLATRRIASSMAICTLRIWGSCRRRDESVDRTGIGDDGGGVHGVVKRQSIRKFEGRRDQAASGLLAWLERTGGSECRIQSAMICQGTSSDSAQIHAHSPLFSIRAQPYFQMILAEDY